MTNDKTAELLHEATSAVCPIDGVRVPNPADKATWLIWFRPEATPDQIAAAHAAMTALVLH
ncbi:MAG: hypothetical protein JWN34_360 [Bryobacterales bacterium]|nr:hypothetical protein [Bryobacterales bacterium]